jgi:hypothetical protein
MSAPSKQLYSMQEVCIATGISEDSIRREMRKGLASRLLVGRRRFLRADVEAWFGLGESAPTPPVKSFTRTRVTEDAREIPASMLPTSRKAVA